MNDCCYSFCHYCILLEVGSPFVCCRKVSPISVISTHCLLSAYWFKHPTLLFIKSRHICEAFCGFPGFMDFSPSKSLQPISDTSAQNRVLLWICPVSSEYHHFLLNQVSPCAVVSNPSFLRNGLLPWLRHQYLDFVFCWPRGLREVLRPLGFGKELGENLF